MRVPLGLPRNLQSSSVTLVGISKMEGPRGLASGSPSARTRRLRRRASLISRWTRLSRRLTSVIIEETVSRREVRVVRTDLRSSSRVVAGAAGSAGAATGAATGAGVAEEAAAATGAAALRPAFFTSAAGAAAATGAGVTTGAATGATTSSVFLATRLALVEEAAAELIILVPVEEFISIKRTMLIPKDYSKSIFNQKPFNLNTGLTRRTFFFEQSPGRVGSPIPERDPAYFLFFSILRPPGFLGEVGMEGQTLKKCANIKSRSHADQPCTLSATHGEFCSRHYKNPRRFLQNQPIIPEAMMTRSALRKINTLQRFWRSKRGIRRFHAQGPAANIRAVAANDTEVYSLESVDTIPQCFFFSFADETKTIWAFDIRSLSHLVTEGNEIVNPYTRVLLDSVTLKKIHDRIVWLRQRKIPIVYVTNESMTQEQIWNQKVLDVFFRMEGAGYRASCRWFQDMNLTAHSTFYRRLHRLWTYQLGLTAAEKEAIMPGYNSGMTKLFRQTPDRIESQIHDLRWWRRANLNLILEFLTRAPQKSQQSLGALYILMALVQVVPEAAEAYPWIRESVGI